MTFSHVFRKTKQKLKESIDSFEFTNVTIISWLPNMTLKSIHQILMDFLICQITNTMLFQLVTLSKFVTFELKPQLKSLKSKILIFGKFRKLSLTDTSLYLIGSKDFKQTKTVVQLMRHSHNFSIITSYKSNKCRFFVLLTAVYNII